MRTLLAISLALALASFGVLSSAAEFPTPGRPITLIVPFSAGGSTDVGARALAAGLEKELGVPVQVVNKPGAGSQIAITELARAKPDGYTLGYTVLPHTVTIYLDAERQPQFGRKSLEFIATHVSDPQFLTVRTDSPYQTTRDLVEAARANPGKIRGAAVGILGPEHLAILQLEKLTGVQFAKVQFDGGAPAMAAVLGGHVDFYMGTLGVFSSAAKAGKVRFLGVMDKVVSSMAPDVKTLKSQGYDLSSYITRVLSLPAGTPKPVVDRIATAVQAVIQSEEHRNRMSALGMTVQFRGPAETTLNWDEVEAAVKPLMSSESNDARVCLVAKRCIGDAIEANAMNRVYQCVGAVLLLLAIATGFEALQLRFSTRLGPGPGFFPFWLAVILGGLGLVLILQATLNAPVAIPADFVPDRNGQKRVATIVVALVGAIILMPIIGFRLMMLLFLPYLLVSLGRPRWWVVAVVTVVGSFGSYELFVRWLSVPLPVGPGGI